MQRWPRVYRPQPVAHKFSRIEPICRIGEPLGGIAFAAPLGYLRQQQISQI
jgi:hypothetical protein